MSVNLFSVETLTGLILGLLLGFFIKNVFKKKEDLGDYSTNLQTLTDKIEKFQEENAEERGEVKEKLKAAKEGSEEVVKAAKAIHRTLVSGGGQQQGAWGELVLNHILTKSLQFRQGQEFETKGFATEEGNKIPDVIVHYPDDRDIIVDSKVSLTAWDEYVNATDEHTKEDALKRHKKSIKDHIDSLAKKNYHKELGIKSLDGVIMFCPNEAAISSLGNSSRLMMEYAIQKKITLVGPAMLYFTLKTVEYYWRAEKQSKNTQQVIKLAEDIGSISIKENEGAKKSVESIKKTSDGIDEVMNKIKDGRGSLLGKVNKMEKVGGISIKESQKIPQESKTDEVE